MTNLFWSKKNVIFITCPKGLSSCLAAEVRELGYPVESELEAAVETEGNLLDAMALNLRLRTGHRVLFLLEECRAETPADLYRRLSRLPWEEWIAHDGYLSVTSTADTPTINDTRFVNVKAKDAIVDRLREKTGSRPDSGPERTAAVVHIYWKENMIRTFLDTSGEPLSRRGYRKIPLQAPMQETLAAGVILSTGWRGEGPFINPMCGSGTLAIEAALIALNRAPGLFRQNYGFMHLRGYEPPVWQRMCDQAREQEKTGALAPVEATDIRAEAVRAGRRNAQNARVDHVIRFGCCSFEKTPVPEGPGVVILNPGYGERMGEERDLADTYRGIGDFFKNRCAGYRGYVFTGNFALAKKIGLRTSRRIPFFNSDIECRLLEYELYGGSRKNAAPDLEERNVL
jgi:23S rRNA G2445 N2-methylase RlmL